MYKVLKKCLKCNGWCKTLPLKKKETDFIQLSKNNDPNTCSFFLSIRVNYL